MTATQKVRGGKGEEGGEGSGKREQQEGRVRQRKEGGAGSKGREVETVGTEGGQSVCRLSEMCTKEDKPITAHERLKNQQPNFTIH